MMVTRTLKDLMYSPDMTAEILAMATEIADGWYPVDGGGKIDWEDVWDRLDGAALSNGDRIDLGEDLLAPELGKIRRHINAARRDG